MLGETRDGGPAGRGVNATARRRLRGAAATRMVRPRHVSTLPPMRPFVLLSSLGFAGLLGCELVVGIHEKTTYSGTPCAQQTGLLFCDDFDSSAEAGDVWLWDTPKGGSSIELDSTAFATAPRSAKFVVPSNAPEAQLGKDVGPLTQHVHVELDLLLDVADLGNVPQTALVQLRSSNVSVNYVVGPGRTCQFYEYNIGGATFTEAQDLPLPPLGRWTHLAIDYDATNGATVVEDGTTILTDPAAAHGPPGDTEIIVGAVYINPPGTTPWTIGVDDVALSGQ